MPFCNRCGKPVEQGRYCDECGKQTAAVQVPVQQPKKPAQMEGSGKKRTGLFVAISVLIAVVAVAAVFVAGWLVGNKDTEESEQGHVFREAEQTMSLTWDGKEYELPCKYAEFVDGGFEPYSAFYYDAEREFRDYEGDLVQPGECVVYLGKSQSGEVEIVIANNSEEATEPEVCDAVAVSFWNAPCELSGGISCSSTFEQIVEVYGEPDYRIENGAGIIYENDWGLLIFEDREIGVAVTVMMKQYPRYESDLENIKEQTSEVGKEYASMVMGTGGSAGTYYAFGGVLGKQISDSTDVDVTVVTSDGSKANILAIDDGDYQLGIVQSDMMSYAWDGIRNFEEEGEIGTFCVIGGLYAEAVQLVSVNPEIKTVADLVGKKVAVGAPGSGVYFNAMDILAAAGLTEDDIIPTYQSYGDSTDAMKDGKIDAAFVVAGAPTTMITDLSRSVDVSIVPIDGEVAAAMKDANYFYTEYIIPAGTYKGQTEDVTTVAIKATLIVSADASEDTVYEITKAIFDNGEVIVTMHPKGLELCLANAIEDIPVPFHAGAAKYFREKGITVKTT